MRCVCMPCVVCLLYVCKCVAMKQWDEVGDVKSINTRTSHESSLPQAKIVPFLHHIRGTKPTP